MPPKVCEAIHTMLKREKVPSICAVHSCMQPDSQQPSTPASALHAAVCDGSTVGRGCLCGSCGLSLLLLAPPAALWRLPGLVQAVLATLSPPVAVAAVLRTLALDAGGECLTWPAGGQAGELGEGGGGAAGGQPTVSEASRGSTAAATRSAASRICANRAGMNRRQRRASVSASYRCKSSTLQRPADRHHVAVHLTCIMLLK